MNYKKKACYQGLIFLWFDILIGASHCNEGVTPRDKHFLNALNSYVESKKKNSALRADLLKESLTYFAENTKNLDKKGPHSGFYQYIEKYSARDPEKIIKLYLFALDYIFMNPGLSDQEAVAIIACSFYLNMKGNLDKVTFVYTRGLMPYMKQANNNIPEQDVYDDATIFTAPIRACHLKLLAGNGP